MREKLWQIRSGTLRAKEWAPSMEKGFIQACNRLSPRSIGDLVKAREFKTYVWFYFNPIPHLKKAGLWMKEHDPEKS